MGILFTGIFAGIQVIWDRQFGFLKESLVAPVSRYEIMLGKTLGGATVAFMQGLFVFILTLLLGVKVSSWTLFPAALIAMFLIATFFTALGIAIASLFEDMQGFQLVMNFVVQPVFFLSGALFPLNGVPKFLQTIAGIDPLSYGVDAVRAAVAGQSHFGLGIDLTVLIVLSLIILSIGSLLFSRVEV